MMLTKSFEVRIYNFPSITEVVHGPASLFYPTFLHNLTVRCNRTSLLFSLSPRSPQNKKLKFLQISCRVSTPIAIDGESHPNPLKTPNSHRNLNSSAAGPTPDRFVRAQDWN